MFFAHEEWQPLPQLHAHIRVVRQLLTLGVAFDNGGAVQPNILGDVISGGRHVGRSSRHHGSFFGFTRNNMNQVGRLAEYLCGEALQLLRISRTEGSGGGNLQNVLGLQPAAQEETSQQQCYFRR